MALDQPTEDLIKSIERVVSNTGGTDTVREGLAKSLKASLAAVAAGVEFIESETRVIVYEDSGKTFVLPNTMTGSQIVFGPQIPAGSIFHFIIMGAVMSSHTIIPSGLEKLHGEIIQGGTESFFSGKSQLEITAGNGIVNLTAVKVGDVTYFSGYCRAGKVLIT